jgi:6-phosphogluconolactonase/glucosamine-6-phosphate isomerase/deaminase
VGDDKAQVVAAVLGDGAEGGRLPAALVRPGDAVEWFIDRAAAEILLRTARPAPEPQ